MSEQPQQLYSSLIIACFEQHAESINILRKSQENQNAKFTEMIAKQADEIVELKKILSQDLYYMDENIAELNSRISAQLKKTQEKQEKQEKKMKKQERKIQGQNVVIYQLLGGLFDQKTQSGILNIHLSLIGESTRESTNECTTVDTSIWRQFPTTRQGDESERRIDIIEKTLMNIGRIITEKTGAQAIEAQAIETEAIEAEAIEAEVTKAEPKIKQESTRAELEEEMKMMKEELHSLRSQVKMNKSMKDNYFGHFQNLQIELEEKDKIIEVLEEDRDKLEEERDKLLQAFTTVDDVADNISESSSGSTSSTISVRRIQNSYDLCGNN